MELTDEEVEDSLNQLVRQGGIEKMMINGKPHYKISDIGIEEQIDLIKKAVAFFGYHLINEDEDFESMRRRKLTPNARKLLDIIPLYIFEMNKGTEKLV